MVKTIFRLFERTQKLPKTGITFLGKLYSCSGVGRIWHMERYTLEISLSKIAGNRVKKNIPWDYHGMSNIPGGDEFLSSIHNNKNQKNLVWLIF